MTRTYARSLSLLVLAVVLVLGFAAPRIQAQSKPVDPGLNKAGGGDPAAVPVACDLLYRKSASVPTAAINAALENPAGVNGWNQVQYAGKPESPYNARRRSLSLLNANKRYDQLTNGLSFKGGCY